MSDTCALARARHETIRELVADMMEASGRALERHGNDPIGLVILTGAIEGFIDDVDRNVLPGFRNAMVTILTADR